MKYDLNSISIKDLLDEVEQMEQSGDHDRTRMANIGINILKRTGERLSSLMDERDAAKKEETSECDYCGESSSDVGSMDDMAVCSSCESEHEEQMEAMGEREDESYEY